MLMLHMLLIPSLLAPCEATLNPSLASILSPLSCSPRFASSPPEVLNAFQAISHILR